jgi:hypothetical protein
LVRFLSGEAPGDYFFIKEEGPDNLFEEKS